MTDTSKTNQTESTSSSPHQAGLEKLSTTLADSVIVLASVLATSATTLQHALEIVTPIIQGNMQTSTFTPIPALPAEVPMNLPSNELPQGALAESEGITTVPTGVEDPSETTTGRVRWYAVLVGRNPGVYCGAQHVTTNVSGIQGSSVQRFETEELAHNAYNTALDAGHVVQVVTTKVILSRAADDDASA